MTPDVKAKIIQATQLQEKIDRLYKQQDELLEPIAKEAMITDDPNKIMELVNAMPKGVIKTELRTYHIKRMEDCEYRRRYNQEK